MAVSGKMLTPLARVRGLGAAKTGTDHFWLLRLTAIAGIPLQIAFMVIVISLLGRNYAALVQILGTPIVAIIMLLFIVSTCNHMRLGMQVIIEDYVQDEAIKLALLIGNYFYCVTVGLASAYALLKFPFGV
jgi:succinate dehydrogenase / fumarate reductase membrane anchor subunit